MAQLPKPTLTQKPADKVPLKVGDPLELEVTAIADGVDTFEYAWTHAGEQLAETANTLRKNLVSATDAGVYQVVVKAVPAGGSQDTASEEQTSWTVTVGDSSETTPEERKPGEWDGPFATKAIVFAVILTVLAAAPILVNLSGYKGRTTTLLDLVVMALLTTGAALGAAGVTLTLLSLRARTRAVSGSPDAGRGIAAPTPEQIVSILEAWGKLKPAMAILIISAGCLLSASLLTYATIPPKPSAPGSSASPSATPSASTTEAPPSAAPTSASNVSVPTPTR